MKVSAPEASSGDDATEDLPPPIEPVIDAVAKHGFFALMSLLERLTPTAPRLGGLGPPSAEAILLRHDPSLSFGAGEVRSTRMSRADDGTLRFELMTTFLGLTGAVSPVPSYIAEEALGDGPAGQARRDLLDVFHHRLLGLLHRAVSQHRFAGEHVAACTDTWSTRLLALSGLAVGGSPGAGLAKRTLLRLAPILSSGRTQSAETLEIALRETLAPLLAGASLAIRQFVPGTVEIDEEDLTRLGGPRSCLGSAVLGRRVADHSAKVEIALGPLTGAQYMAFLPGGEGFQTTRSSIAMLGLDGFEYDLDLRVWSREVPGALLSTRSRQELGRNTWLRRSADSQSTLNVKVPLRDP